MWYKLCDHLEKQSGRFSLCYIFHSSSAPTRCKYDKCPQHNLLNACLYTSKEASRMIYNVPIHLPLNKVAHNIMWQ